MNILTLKDYKKIKDKTVTVVHFENGRRVMTIAGFNYKQAIEYSIEKSELGAQVMFFKGDFAPLKYTREEVLEEYNATKRGELK